MQGDAKLVIHNDRSLLALQGPKAVGVLQKYVDIDLSEVYFSNFHKLDIKGVPSYLTRTGYACTSTLLSVQRRRVHLAMVHLQAAVCG